jgi:predicted DNA-binding transcriptional regulator YafY
MKLLTYSSLVQRTSNTDFSQLDGAYLAIDTQRGYCYSLNATGGRIWEMLVKPIRLSEICATLQTQYAVEEKTCRQEILALVATLKEAGLLQVLPEI